MYELKTKPSDKNPIEVINNIPNNKKQDDALELLEIYKEVTGETPFVWGEKMIGFGKYKYKYASGHMGEFYKTGFSVTKAKITLHLYMEEEKMQIYLGRLGKATSGKSCIYINKLADIDIAVLKEMIMSAWDFAKDDI